ncbi:nuclear inhibitor of protein phosphatase 1-like protein [Leptotrombidium deliense]|uniref:Nuclear inhibitor of protein phosphatase 1 n=1 Tax=Leptotrombidium deliense TaxID=299467 RepID=A0A443SJT1_9ACAR|nr:nuclear inhibitor of protein phosphatase 1-like protein [Leptotrombidium deliense]
MANNHYDVPSWAGKPSQGLHLDVLKDTKLIQKLMIDEKKCYLFGRNPNLNDFCIDHASCSRVHAALVYHKHLNRAFLVDLGSTHGTFIGSVRIESNKPTQLPIDSTFHFGASTRFYVLREKPNQKRNDADANTEDEMGVAGLPETELELDNLTEYNTAHNKRISMLGITDEQTNSQNRKRKHESIRFKEEEEVINPEDIDPTVGKFRNLVQTAVIPTKKVKSEAPLNMGIADRSSFHVLRPGHEKISPSSHVVNPLFSTSLSLKLGIHLPNPAPEIDFEKPMDESMNSQSTNEDAEDSGDDLPKKKKYAKEAWPGRKPGSLLM